MMTLITIFLLLLELPLDTWVNGLLVQYGIHHG